MGKRFVDILFDNSPVIWRGSSGKNVRIVDSALDSEWMTSTKLF